MIIKTFLEPPIDNNNYLIVDDETKEAALIDCSAIDIWDKISVQNGFVDVTSAGSNRSELFGIKLKYILLTHGHFDHIAGIRNDYFHYSDSNHTEGVEVLMHKGDVDWLNNVNQFMPMFGMPLMTIPVITRYIDDGNIIKLGNSDIKVIYTPGHTQGGVCYYVDGNLFSGDTIFRESVGRCDLEGGDFEQLVKSIREKIYTLPDETVIYPGHGKSTTVGWEKSHNKFL